MRMNRTVAVPSSVERCKFASSSDCTNLAHSVRRVDVADIDYRTAVFGEENMAFPSAIAITGGGD